MRMSLATRVTMGTVHGIAMLGVGIALLYIRATMTNVVFYVFGCLCALLLVSVSLLFSATLDWIYAAGIAPHHRTELKWYLLLSAVSGAGALFFAVAPSASIRLLCYFIAVHSLLLGVAKLRLARHWKRRMQEKIVVTLLGCITACFAVVLVAIANGNARNAIAVLAAYVIFVGMQALLYMVWLYRANIVPAASPAH